MYYAQNRDALLQHPWHTSIVAELDQLTPSEDVTLEATEAGDYTVIYKNLPLHSKQGADTEARQLAQQYIRPGYKHHHALFGLGLGYGVQAVFELSEGHLYVYESERRLLRFILENVDLSEYFESGRVKLATSPQELINLLSQNYNWGDELDVYFNEGYAKLWGGELTRLVKEDVMSSVQMKRNSVGSVFAFQQHWNQQFIRNIPHLTQAEPFAPFENRFKGKPAIIISAGPSLDKALEDIRALADKAILIAAGTALRALSEAGITPDFAVFLDYQGPKQQLHGLTHTTGEISFILGPFSEEVCHTVPSKRRLLVNLKNYFQFSDWIAKHIGALGPEMTSGATVSIFAMQSAWAMGCSPVILAGQDLALSGTQLYAGGAEGKATTGSIDDQGFLIIEDSETTVGKKLALVTVSGQQGEPLQSTPDYAQYINDFSEQARRYRLDHPDAELYNVSEGGALIEGFNHCTLSALREKMTFETFDKTINEQNLETTFSAQSKRQNLIRGTQTIRSVITDCQKLAEEAKGHLKYLLQGITEKNGVSHERRYMRAFQEFTKRIFAQDVLSHMLQAEIWMLYHHSNETPETREDVIAHLQLEEKFYTVCLSAFDNLLPILDDSLRDLKDALSSQPDEE